MQWTLQPTTTTTKTYNNKNKWRQKVSNYNKKPEFIVLQKWTIIIIVNSARTEEEQKPPHNRKTEPNERKAKKKTNYIVLPKIKPHQWKQIKSNHRGVAALMVVLQKKKCIIIRIKIIILHGNNLQIVFRISFSICMYGQLRKKISRPQLAMSWLEKKINTNPQLKKKTVEGGRLSCLYSLRDI